MKLLLKYQVMVNVQHKDGWTPLNIAVVTGQTEIVKLLLSNGAKVPSYSMRTIEDIPPPLIHASIEGYGDIVKMLLDNHADPEVTNHKRKTPLMLAAEAGHRDAVNYLLYKGAVIPIKDFGYSALRILWVQIRPYLGVGKYRQERRTNIASAEVRKRRKQKKHD
jgi:ankyrin repeat protein